MNVISISTDRKIFDPKSDVYKRMLEYGKLFDELHIVIFATKILGFKDQKIAENIWIYPTNSYFKLLYIHTAKKISKKIIKARNFNFKNTVITSQDPFETGIVGAYINKKFHLPFQIQVHTDLFSSYFASKIFLNRIRVRLSKRILPHADEIRVVSGRIKNSILEKNKNISIEKIDVLPVFVDTSKFDQPVTKDLKKVYPQFNFIILMASRLAPEKNIFSGLRILKELVQKNKKTGMIIVGEGQELSNLKKYTEKLGLKENVIFEPWQHDLVSYYKSSTLFLITSLYEGFGLTLLEAGLSGAAIVTSNVGIAESLFKNGENSFVCNVNDEDCFIKKILILMNDNGLREFFKIHIKEDVSEFVVSDSQLYFESYKKLLAKALALHNNF